MDSLENVINTIGQNIEFNKIQSVENAAEKIPTTKTFDIDNIQQEENKIKIDLFQSDIDVAHIAAKTPDAKSDSEVNNANYLNPSQQTSFNADSTSHSFGTQIKTREQLRSGIRAFLYVTDYIISFAAMKIAKDTKQSSYTPDKDSRKMLEDVLVEYFYGKQTDMPLWATLLFAILGSYGVILFGAVQKRKNDSSVSKNKFQDSIITPLKIATVDNLKVPEIPKTFKEASQPVYKGSFQNPDANITAESTKELYDYVAKNIYPLYKRNKNGKVIKVRYNSKGIPLLAGKPSKIAKLN
ncbi:MAG: hypothetical protein IT243_06105 [Bacteroidia bacterium]|nr:hypothetical protein [Bacteroidia bacterium]